MVQTISTFRGNLPLSANFEPTGTSGLNFGVSAGAVTGHGAIVESAAGNVAVPASSSWSIYASFTTGLLVGAATSAVPSTDALILFQGGSDSSSITTWTDVRSFASTGLISGGVGFDEYLTTNATVVHDWKLNEASGTIEDFGTATDIDLNANGANITYSETGDVGYETDTAVGFDGSSSSYCANVSAGSAPNQTSGSIGAVFKANIASPDVIFSVGPNLSTVGCILRLITGGGEDVFEYRINDNGSGYNADTQSEKLGTGTISDGNYHMIVVTQTGTGGGGPTFYVDGVAVAQGFTAYANGGSANDWFNAKQGAGQVAIGAHNTLANNNFDGDIARVWITSDVMSAGTISQLNAARFAPV